MTHYWFSMAVLVCSSFVAYFIICNVRRKRAIYFKSPFATRPRPAGHTLQEKTNDLFIDMLQWLFFITLFALIPFTATKNSSVSVILSIISITCISYSIWKMVQIFKSYEQHNLGLKGEQLVGMTLDRLSSNEIKIFHDYPVQEKGKNPWNIDHVVVAPTGVYAVETKTRSKRHYHEDKKGHVVIYENGTLKYPTSEDQHGLEQAERQANYLSKLLTSSTGSEISVTPVLVIPGWFVERKSKEGIFVANEKQLHGLLKGAERIDAKKRQQVCHQLEQVCIVE